MCINIFDFLPKSFSFLFYLLGFIIYDFYGMKCWLIFYLIVRFFSSLLQSYICIMCVSIFLVANYEVFQFQMSKLKYQNGIKNIPQQCQQPRSLGPANHTVNYNASGHFIFSCMFIALSYLVSFITSL
jgi:hypothetical protein